MPAQQRGQSLELLTAGDTASGISRAVEHQQAGAWGDAALQTVEIQLETGGSTGGHDHAVRSGKSSHLGVAQPVGGWNEHLVAGVQQHLKQVVDRLLATVGHQHLLGGGGTTVFLRQLLGDRLAQVRVPGCGPVAGDAIGQGLAGRFRDEVRRIEIRFTGTEAADVSAILLQGLGLGADLKRERRLQGNSPLGQFRRALHGQRTDSRRVKVSSCRTLCLRQHQHG